MKLETLNMKNCNSIILFPSLGQLQMPCHIVKNVQKTKRISIRTNVTNFVISFLLSLLSIITVTIQIKSFTRKSSAHFKNINKMRKKRET